MQKAEGPSGGASRVGLLTSLESVANTNLQAVLGTAVGQTSARHCAVQLQAQVVAIFVFVFQEKKHSVSTRKLALLSLAVGLVGGIYGIGGGAIMAPFLVSFFALPVYAVAGATLFATFLTSVAGVSFYFLLAPFYPDMAVAPDWRMGLLVGLGGMCGMYLGARCQKYMPATLLKCLLAAILLFTAIRYLGQGF